MKQIFALAILASMILLVSCDKNVDTQDIKVEGALIGKWTLLRSIDVTVRGSSVRKDTTVYDPGDFMQIESGGQIIVRAGATSQSYWKLLDEGKTLFIEQNGILDVPNNGYQIQTLTSQSLVLYSKEGTATNYDEVTIYLQK